MRGLEGMPLRLTASLVIVAIIVSIGFYELTVFLDFQQQKNFKESIVDARQAIRTLQTLGDFGAFSSLQMRVSQGYSVTLDNTTDIITGSLPSGENFTVNLTADLKEMYFPSGVAGNTTTLPAGEYEIRLVYGYADSPKNYSIYFR